MLNPSVHVHLDTYVHEPVKRYLLQASRMVRSRIRCFCVHVFVAVFCIILSRRRLVCDSRSRLQQAARPDGLITCAKDMML